MLCHHNLLPPKISFFLTPSVSDILYKYIARYHPQAAGILYLYDEGSQRVLFNFTVSLLIIYYKP